jgi:hypothetical protein
MTKNELILAARLLDLASDLFSNHCCNDLDLDEMTPQEAHEFQRRMHEWNGDPEEAPPIEDATHSLDFFVMAFLAHLLRESADRLGDSG